MPAPQPIGRLIADWLGAREDFAAFERATHSDITDHHGRVWVWWKGSLYRHCGMAWLEDMVRDENHGLPNVRYAGMCETCAPMVSHQHWSESLQHRYGSP